MESSSMEEVEGYLEAQGLEFQRMEEDTIATGFSIQSPGQAEVNLPLDIQIVKDAYGDSYLRFTIVPFLQRPEEEFSADFFVTSMQVNHDMPRLKLALDRDGDLELILDTPAGHMNESEFRVDLQVLVDYAGEFIWKLQQSLQDSPG